MQSREEPRNGAGGICVCVHVCRGIDLGKCLGMKAFPALWRKGLQGEWYWVGRERIEVGSQTSDFRSGE